LKVFTQPADQPAGKDMEADALNMHNDALQISQGAMAAHAAHEAEQ
jgi:hypothetical protein